MENKLEQLLNSLIEKGWKPTNRAKRGDIYKCEVRGLPGYVNVRFFLKDKDNGNYGMNIRELVSKESGLWQFVCENELTRKIRSGSEWKHNAGDEEEFNKRDYQYRLIESALKDESELEDFLLNSIKLD